MFVKLEGKKKKYIFKLGKIIEQNLHYFVIYRPVVIEI